MSGEDAFYSGMGFCTSEKLGVPAREGARRFLGVTERGEVRYFVSLLFIGVEDNDFFCGLLVGASTTKSIMESSPRSPTRRLSMAI